MIDLSKAAIGSKWKLGTGEVVTFSGPNLTGSFADTNPFSAVDKFGVTGTYRQNGQYYTDGDPSVDDIVALYEPAPPTNVLQEALAVAGQGAERARDYGHPLDNHERIRVLQNAYDQIKKTSGAPDNCFDVAFKMILLKIARHMNSPKRDNLVDICGYTLCIEQMEAEQKARAAK